MNKINAKSRITIIFVIVEIMILLLGVTASVSETTRAASHSSKFIPFYLFAALGVAFAVILFLWRSKRAAALIGAGMILFYLVAAGWGAYYCELHGARLRRLDSFKDKQVTAQLDGAEYVWDNKSVFYEGRKLVPLDANGEEHSAQVFVDGEKSRFPVYTSGSGTPDKLYVQIYGGATGDFLELSKASK